jgi:hypothetical protein
MIIKTFKQLVDQCIMDDAVIDTGGTICIDETTDPSSKRFCSRAVTGRRPSFQEIYVCRTCCCNDHTNHEHLPVCVCSSCADVCHADHDIDFVGVGPCFCDCSDLNCSIVSQSIIEANRLGFSTSNDDNFRSTVKCEEPTSSYIRNVYHINLLNDDEFRRRLILQANELVRHSKDTFWLDAETGLRFERDNLCDLECFAWRIFLQHMENYFHDFGKDNSQSNTKQVSGAEWWVQVKTISSDQAMTSATCGKAHSAKSVEAIDLHYDKDEEMAALFGIGMFPSLSTVTYLTDAVNSPPTIIFPRRYDEVDDDVNPCDIRDMFISHPMLTKHIAFDGRLLHGAPSHLFLRREALQNKESQNTYETDSVESKTRITLLVNLWLGHKPLGVHVLPDSIRAAICATTSNVNKNVVTCDTPIELIPGAPAYEIELKNEMDLPELLRVRIELPFVGGKATWSVNDNNNNKEEEYAIVVSTYPPPAHPKYDTILVQFGSSLGAKFQYNEG